MSKAEAHAILDAAKAGQPVPVEDIRAALFFTGDLRPVRPVAVDKSEKEQAE
jgi:hypothetical protein